MGTTEMRAELLELILDVSFRRQKVTLASGAESDFYLDLRQTLMRPRGLVLAGALVLDRLLAGPPVHAVGGMAVGAVPLVSVVLAAAAGRDPATALLGFFLAVFQMNQAGLDKLMPLRVDIEHRINGICHRYRSLPHRQS